MKRVVIYSRVSTQDQQVQNQIDQLTAYANQQSWHVIETISDVGSGAKGVSDRKGLEQVLLMAHQKKVDLVLFWALDRFSREGSRKTIGYLTQLESMGVGFHSYMEPYLSTLGIFSDSIIALLSALAKQERIRISERTRAGLERVRNNGRRLGRPRTSNQTIQKASALREQGLSFSKIGNELGVTAQRAYQLCNSTV